MDTAAPVALVTGAAHRIGACIARTLHGAGYRVLLHHHRSAAAAAALAAELAAARPDSARTARADLLETARLPALVEGALAHWGRLDLLVNNASAFFPTPVGSVTEADWERLLGTNLKAPFFVAQAAAPHLAAAGGSIVNIVDIHAERPLAGHPVYSIAKAGLAALTRALARELGPAVRVNGVAPGAILWPEQGVDPERMRLLLARTPLGRTGSPEDVARAVLFLARDAPYVSGQILAVDGGRSVVD
ncbi:pteridine reductase [Inmirania thermothiophila]|uniref:Pteridine reductase n=1 Tax=Inmirania thermothiophila TaxID=1750597 RepID=A0A3N1Y6Z7_9GAMM|nr:pteridine reductase [Inmirania thermothiophila]ROR34520.1 pteridine reductase [Inmirania thermothiophila]